MPFDSDYGQAIKNEHDPEKIKEIRKDYFSKIPVCTASEEELTRQIRRVVPDYVYDKPATEEEAEKRRKRPAAAQNALCDAVENKEGKPYCAAGRTLFDKDRESGSNLGTYIHEYMKDKEPELLELAEQGRQAENYKERCKQLQRDVFRHIAKNAATYTKEIKAMGDDELIEKWETVSTILRLGDVTSSLQPYNCFEAEEQEQISHTLEPFQTLMATVNMRMELLANPASPSVNIGQMMEYSKDQLAGLHDVFQGILKFTDPKINQDTVVNWNIADKATFHVGSAYESLAHKVYNSVGLVRDRGCKMIAQDLGGNTLSESEGYEEIWANHRPVYFLPQEGPDKTPVLAFMKDGELLLGEDAFLAFAETPATRPIAPDESRKPTGIWDSICKLFGWESWRSESARQYDADVAQYQQDLAIYNETMKFQSNMGQMMSPETLEKVRTSMLEDKFGKDAEKYVADVAAQREEEERNAAEARAKEEAENKIKAEKNAKIKIFTDKMDQIDSLTDAQKTMIKEQLKCNEGRLDRARASTYNEKKTELPKERCVATALACHIVENCIMQGLDDLAKGVSPSAEFHDLLNVGSLKPSKKAVANVDRLIAKFKDDENVIQMANGMSKEEIEALCPMKPSVSSDRKIADVMAKCHLLGPAKQPTNAPQPAALQNEAAHVGDANKQKDVRSVTGP